MTDTLLKTETGLNGFKYSAFIRYYGDGKFCSYIESDEAPLFRGATLDSREAAENEAARMLAIYTNLKPLIRGL